MVLEDATSPEEPTAYPDSAPTSDADPYSDSSSPRLEATSSGYLRLYQAGTNEPLDINVARLPQRLSIFGSGSPNTLANGIASQCQHANKLLQRPIRQEEADAFAEHWARSMQVASYGTPVGVSLAMLVAYRGKNYRFPGWSPMKSGRFTPNTFGPLRGSAARLTWNVLRYNLYGIVGMTLGGIFFASYALTLHAANRAMDPRLKEYGDALQQKMSGKLMERPRQPEGRGTGETFEMAKQRHGAQQRQVSSQQPAQTGGWGSRGRPAKQDDDMSPTSGAYEDDFMDAGRDTGMIGDGQARDQQRRAENAISTYDASEPTVQPSARPSRSVNSSAQQPQQTQRQPTGGAWDRLRKDAMSGKPANPVGALPTRSGPSKVPAKDVLQNGDSFSFSNGEQEAQLARSEAQKQFDERVEREREGHDFNEKGGDDENRKW